MNLRDEEQLQRYFEHKMSAGEEQNFLIDIAARDDMRLAFRSQLELLKALRADKDATMVTAALVRSHTLSALGLGASLLPNALKEKEQEVAQSAAMPVSNGSRLWSFVRRPAAMLVAGLLAGAAIVYSIVPNGTSTQNHNASKPVISAPATIEIPAPAPQQATHAVGTPNTTAPTATLSAPHQRVATKTTKPQKDALPIVTKTNSAPIQVHTNVHSGDDSSK